MNHTRPSPEDLLERAARVLRETPVPEEGLAAALGSTRAALAQAQQARPDAPQTQWPSRLWGILMRHKGLTVSTAAVVLVGVVAVLLSELTVPQVAFAEVLERMGAVQTLHMKFTRGGRSGEAWLKRPNMVRAEYEDGTYEIHNGPTQWVVDEKANKVVGRPSWYYQDAQPRGVDVVDMLIELPQTEGLSGFFSEGPVDRVRQGGRLLDVYKMDLEERGGQLKFEALVDARTHILQSAKLQGIKDGETEVLFAFTLLEYDQPIADEKFAFQPKEGMTVVVQEPKQKGPVPVPAKGSTLSGHIVWASTGKPVPAATVTISGGDYVQDESGRSRQEFFTRVETDREGRWEVSGVPAGRASISPRSWELNWPSVPTFGNRLGSLQHPAIQVDGEGRYDGLDFTVYKPEELFARITVNVTDEDGKPVEGVGGYLMGDRPAMQHYGHVYAAPGKQFTGPDGKLDARDVWPTEEPARLHVYHREDGGPFVTRAVTTEPFVVESKKSYHFDITIPYERQLKLRVVNRDGQPLGGVLVMAQKESGEFIFTGYRADRGPGEGRVFTDEEGRITVTRLMPEEDVIIVLRRLARKDADLTSPVATSWASVRVPEDREPSSLEVVFDDRPIRVEGSIPVPPEALLRRHVYCIGDRGPRALGLDLSLWDNLDESGGFVLTGVPAGDVRLRYLLVTAEGEVRQWQSENTIATEPGKTYTVRITGDRVEVTDVRPSEPQAVPQSP